MKDSDIKYFKDILKDRVEQIEKNILASNKGYQDLNSLEINDEGDYSLVCSDSLIETSIAKQQKKELDEITYALLKIENGTYGTCEMCEEPVGFQRLKVKPHAKYCIVCREILEKQQKKS